MLQTEACQERRVGLDVLRGFALLGIFLMNIEFFSRPLQDIDGEGIDSALRGFDYAADALIYFFVQSKFWTLFSLLFGIGFALMIERAEKAGRKFFSMYLRRTLALAAIGTAHALLIWSGDILLSYAICALLLLAARQLRRMKDARSGGVVAPVPPERLMKWGSALYALPIAMALLGGVLGSLQGEAPPHAEQPSERSESQVQREAERVQAIEAYRVGSYRETVRQRIIDTRWQMGSLAGFALLLCGVFLIGAGLLRSGVMEESPASEPVWRVARNFGLPLGFGLMALSTALGTSLTADEFTLVLAVQISSYLLAGLILAIAYAATLLLALQGRARGWLLRWLAPAGQMALSNYLLQSLVGTLVFNGYGLGLWGQVSRAGQVVLVLVVFALQLYLSRWWLARYRMGPVEWLWRAITYLQWPVMRRAG